MGTQVEERPHAGALIRTAAQTLAAAGVENPSLDAELLMAAAAGVSRAQILAGTVVPDAAAIARFSEFVARRAAREPLAYITGHKEFFSLEFEVTPAVLIPRPETETLVVAALEAIAGCSAPRVLDLGTGSGAIAIAIAHNAPRAQVVATDISKAALEVARRNARRLGCAARVEFVAGDLWAALAGLEMFEQRFDVIVSNPPYVEDAALKALAPEIARFEPRVALTGGSDGLAFYRRIAARVRDFLKPGGKLFVEVGLGQAASVSELFRAAGAVETTVLKDLAGMDRVVSATF